MGVVGSASGFVIYSLFFISLASQGEALDAAVGGEMAEAVGLGEEPGVDSGADEDSAVGEDGDAAVGLAAQLVEEAGHAAVDVAVALAARSRQVHVVVVPPAYGGVLALDVVVEAVLPVAHIHLLQSVVEGGGGIAAGGGKQTGAGEWRGVHLVEVDAVELAARDGGLLFKGVGHGDVCPAVAGAAGNGY